MACLVKVCDNCVPAVKRRIESICPNIYRIFWGTGRCECLAIRTVLGLAFGALLGAGLYFSVVDKLDFPEEERQLFGGFLTLCIAVGFATSVQMRCIVLLVVPTFCGRYGRSLITSLAIYLLISGPMHNIMANAEESSRSISCTSDLTFNHSKEIFKLLYKPFHDAFADAGVRQGAIDADADQIKGQFHKYVDEIEGGRWEKMGKFKEEDKTSETVEQGFKLKSLRRCKDVFVDALAGCEEAYDEVWKKCKKRFRVGGLLLCLPLHAVSVCTVIKLLQGMCASLPSQPQETIQMFMRVKHGVQALNKNFNVDLKWKSIRFPTEFLNKTAIEGLVRQMNYELQLKKQWLDAIVFVATVLVSFTFVLVFMSASGYNTKYLKDNEFDNVYMTAYFRKIDARRKKLNKRTLLPLKKSQKIDIIETVRWKLRKEEKKSMLLGLLRLTMRLIVTFALVFFDQLFFLTLDLIQRHSHLDYTFKGEQVLQIKVLGSGLIAEMFKKILSSFDQHQSVHTISTNRHCLPVPSAPDNRGTMVIFAAWGAVWLSLYFEAYALRLRRLICAYFYPKKEKQRVVFLYNEQLKKRVGFLKHLRYKVRQLAQEQRLLTKIGTLTSLRTHWPKLCFCLGFCGLGGRHCLICDENEKDDFQTCPEEGCDFIYCSDCWRDVKRVCYACKIYVEKDEGDDDDFLSESD